jgi:hypothetical protein
MPKFLATFHPLVIEARSLEHARDIATFARIVPQYDAMREATEEEVDVLLNADGDREAYDNAEKVHKVRTEPLPDFV